MTAQKFISLAELAGQDPNSPAVRDDFKELSWAELDRRVSALGRGLMELGLLEFDHIAIVVSNRSEFLESYLATIRAGFTQTPIKTNWTKDQISYLLKDAGSKAIITDIAEAKLAAEAASLPVIDVDDGFENWLNQQSDEPLPVGGRGYRIPYTSGTTGKPKGVSRVFDVEVTFEQWAKQNAIGASALNLPTDGWHLMVSQMFHGAPSTFGIGALFGGAPMRIVAKWSADKFAGWLKEGVTATIMVPTMFRQLLALPESERAAIDPSNLATVLHGGEGCPVKVKQEMIDWWGPIFSEYYGFTEGGMTFASPDDWAKKPGTVGLPIGNMKVDVVDDELKSLGPNEVGSLYFHHPTGKYFKYMNDDKKTDRAYLSNGSFGVGDIGYLDEDGYLFISGRTAELIVSAGVNIYPAEIEAVLFEIDGVLDAAVVAGPDEIRGEQPVAFIVAGKKSSGEESTQAEIADAINKACQEKLASNMVPRRINFIDEIPRDPTGKTLRVQLKNELFGNN